MSSERLTIAVQKSGRLSKESLKLLEACGVKFNLHEQRLMAHSTSHPIDLLRVRDDDIPGLVMDGVVDLGLVVKTCLKKSVSSAALRISQAVFQSLRRLDSGFCRL